jgi:hypothetical protein
MFARSIESSSINFYMRSLRITVIGWWLGWASPTVALGLVRARTPATVPFSGNGFTIGPVSAAGETGRVRTLLSRSFITVTVRNYAQAAPCRSPDWEPAAQPGGTVAATSVPASANREKSPTAAKIEIAAMASTPGIVIRCAITGSPNVSAASSLLTTASSSRGSSCGTASAARWR